MYITLRMGGKGYTRTVHRLMLEAFVGPRPDKHECRHADNDRTNNAIGNLSWGTKSQNQSDRVRHGTDQVGERNPSAKLTATKVRRMRRERQKTGISYARLGHKNGITKAAARFAVTGKTWGHVK